MNFLAAEPSADGVCALPTTNIPALREQLSIVISTGKAKNVIGVQFLYEQAKRLTDKDVEKYYKRYESFMDAKTTETLIDNFLILATRVVGKVEPIYNIQALQKELRNDYIITKELFTFAGNLALKCEKFLALQSKLS